MIIGTLILRVCRFSGMPVPTLAAGMLLLLGSQACRAESPASRNNEGNRFYSHGRFDEAEKAYLDAEAKSPGKSEVIYNLGNANIRQKKYGSGIQALRQVIEKGQNDIKQKSWFNIGDALFLMGDYKAAAGAFIEALKLNPGDTEAKHNLEMALKKRSEAENRRSAEKRQDGDNPQQKRPERGESTFTREQTIQLLEAIRNQEIEEQRRMLQPRLRQRTDEKDW